MIIIKNQPVNFDNDTFANPYVDEIKYKQLVQQGDITQFQFQTNADFNGQNVLLNPNFQLSLADWYLMNSEYNQFFWSDGVLGYSESGSSRGGASKIAQDSLIVGNKYEVTINITRSLGGYWRIYLGSNLIGQKTTGIHKISGVCEERNYFVLQFVPTTSGRLFQVSSGSIDYVYCAEKQTNNHRFQIIDTEDGTVVQTLNAVNDYLSDPYTESSFAQFIDSSLTMSIDWQTLGIANGCYKIGVCDADINRAVQCGVLNSELVGGIQGPITQLLANWDVDYTGTGGVQTVNPAADNWGNVMFYTNVPGDEGIMHQPYLLSGVSYEYSINIVNISGAGANLVVSFGSQTVTFTTAGTKTGTITADGNIIDLTFTATAAGYSTVSFVRVQATAATLVPDYYSNPFNLQTTHHRTVVVNCNNSENVFGLNYETVVWTPRARLRGYLAPADQMYETERLSAETLRGRRDVYYFKRRKQKLLIIENEPEFIHDWLAMFGGHDHAMINHEDYFINEDEYPTVSWDYFRVLGSTQILVGLKEQLEIKTIKGVIKSPQFIVDSDGNGVSGGFLTDIRDNRLADPFDPTIFIQALPSGTADTIQ